MRVSNLINDKGNEVRNQFVIETANGTYFQSYESVVARIDNSNVLTFGENWGYSNTTLKHLHKFLRDYGYDDTYAKLRKRIDSGEIKIVNLSFD